MQIYKASRAMENESCYCLGIRTQRNQEAEDGFNVCQGVRKRNTNNNRQWQRKTEGGVRIK